MTFVDPDTGLLVSCQPWEYEQIRGKFIKTKWETGGVGNGNEKS